MALKLKQYRVKAGLTQAVLAKAVGVSQPNYQRWESGAAPVPEDKLKKLAKALKTGVDVLQGTHPPINAGFYDRSVGEDLNYYGEVAIHFRGEGKPILLSISDGAFSRLHRCLQSGAVFVTVESLANQTVIIRTQAIADLYFSSEAYDDYGPEHDNYEDHVDLQMPDPRDWEIVEAIACDGVGLEDFSEADIQRITERIMITDEQYEKLVADGLITSENLEAERAKNQEETDRIYALAMQVTYQFSNGCRRSVGLVDVDELFEAFQPLLEDVDDEMGEDLIRLPVERWHRIAFINKHALDYVMLPTHRFDRGRIEMEAKFLDEPV
ncbi:Helix-turn-helix [Pollutimonas bauzanensis]|uniref:Helix-turn-helix n=2 Tax=Pollutimonas bauzanensis TaxID=658167 RepID=A0A1M5ZSM1_9BURK|nr:Helix-turn-helix [Pollutimonas bauzanensis]